MIEEIIIHAQVLEGQPPRINDQLSWHDSVFSKLEPPYMIVQLVNLEKAHLYQSLLLLPLSSIKSISLASTIKLQSLVHSSLFNITRLPKLEISLFTRKNFLNWLFQIEHFFNYHQIIDD